MQAGALEVLTEIVNKRMDAEAKLSLLQQLNLGSMLSGWQRELPGDPVGDVPLKAARLLTAVCNGQLLILFLEWTHSSRPLCDSDGLAFGFKSC